MMIVMMLEMLMIEMVNDDDSDAGYDKEKDSE